MYTYENDTYRSFKFMQTDEKGIEHNMNDENWLPFFEVLMNRRKNSWDLFYTYDIFEDESKHAISYDKLRNYIHMRALVRTTINGTMYFTQTEFKKCTHKDFENNGYNFSLIDE